MSRRAGAGFLAAATAIALDRVLLGLHYLGDIAAGALVGPRPDSSTSCAGGPSMAPSRS